MKAPNIFPPPMDTPLLLIVAVLTIGGGFLVGILLLAAFIRYVRRIDGKH